MKAKLISTATSNYELFTHCQNYYVIPDRELYGDFLRSIELSYFTNTKYLYKQYSASYGLDYSIFVNIALDEASYTSKHPYYLSKILDKDTLALYEWYEDKEDILHIMEELMSIFEDTTNKYATFEYIRSMPSLVYDDKKKDWVISDSELETVVVVNNISVREYRKANSILTSPMPDYVFRIVQALHYFNNLVRAEKVPDWVHKIIDDYEVYRLLDA